MTDAERDAYRQKLLKLWHRLNGDVSGLSDEALRKTGGEASGNLSNTPFHLADLGTDNFEQEMSLSLLETEEQRLEEVAAALDRITQGTYARCEKCQQEIPRARLDAVPYARFCVHCAREEQQENGQVPTPGGL